uniref:Zf-3CxxC domain-containing protein n=1 Tax=Caenorhabditis tropicalis TaxID=1561998 RepID=A0A1I7UHC2_9PELO
MSVFWKQDYYKDDICEEGSTEHIVCGYCKYRKGKFVGNCSAQGIMCRYCCFSLLLEAMRAHTDGPLAARCKCCDEEITTLTRRKLRSPDDEYQDENAPNGYVEHTFSLTDFAASIIAGEVNRGFESSSSR